MCSIHFEILLTSKKFGRWVENSFKPATLFKSTLLNSAEYLAKKIMQSSKDFEIFLTIP